MQLLSDVSEENIPQRRKWFYAEKKNKHVFVLERWTCVFERCVHIIRTCSITHCFITANNASTVKVPVYELVVGLNNTMIILFCLRRNVGVCVCVYVCFAISQTLLQCQSATASHTFFRHKHTHIHACTLLSQQECLFIMLFLLPNSKFSFCRTAKQEHKNTVS